MTWLAQTLESPLSWLVFAVLVVYLHGHASRGHCIDPVRKAPRVRARSLMTGNEREFCARMRRALGVRYEVVPQVAMGALIDVALPRTHPQFWSTLERFSRKVVDFVVCERGSMRVIAVVELDDRTHDPERDRQRDALMLEAGIRTLRWDSRAKPSETEIAAAFAKLTAVGLTGAVAAR
jgi:hypothetical protein